jgi:hypothetical protein
MFDPAPNLTQAARLLARVLSNVRVRQGLKPGAGRAGEAIALCRDIADLTRRLGVLLEVLVVPLLDVTRGAQFRDAELTDGDNNDSDGNQSEVDSHTIIVLGSHELLIRSKARLQRLVP